MQFDVELADEAATVAWGERLGQGLDSPCLVFLDGELGAGKTTFSRGVLRAFGYQGAVKSPTYTLVEPYELAEQTLYHFDLYRLGDPEELEYMGIRDYLNGNAICLVEWSERGAGILPSPDIRVNIVQQGLGRKLTLQAESERGKQLITKFKAL